jgi:hypothetical protein
MSKHRRLRGDALRRQSARPARDAPRRKAIARRTLVPTLARRRCICPQAAAPSRLQRCPVVAPLPGKQARGNSPSRWRLWAIPTATSTVLAAVDGTGGAYARLRQRQPTARFRFLLGWRAAVVARDRADKASSCSSRTIKAPAAQQAAADRTGLPSPMGSRSSTSVSTQFRASSTAAVSTATITSRRAPASLASRESPSSGRAAPRLLLARAEQHHCLRPLRSVVQIVQTEQRARRHGGCPLGRESDSHDAC